MYREFELIERIRAHFELAETAPMEGVKVGIGDDCAVFEPGAFDLISTDTMVEGVHFRRDWSAPADIGFKALAVSLSDVAAMGGRPGAFLLNLSIPPQIDRPFVDELVRGIKEACDAFVPAGFRIAPVGGDVTGSRGPLCITTTVLGKSAAPGAVLRSGARPGDRIVLVGPTGRAQAGLDLLSEQFKRSEKGENALNPQDFPALLRAHRRPRPRVIAGHLIGQSGLATAMIDTSDGLFQDLGHILKASNVGARIQADRLPRHPELVAFCRRISGPDFAGSSEALDPVEALEICLLGYLLGGGEDFQLCFTAPEDYLEALRRLMQQEERSKNAPQSAVQLFDIGEIRPPEDGLHAVDSDGKKLRIAADGYEHFVS